MQLRRSLLLSLLSIAVAEATLVSRSTSLVSRTAHRVHHAAIKRSAGLARDLRAIVQGVVIEQRASTDTANRAVYCVANRGITSLTNGNSANSTNPGPVKGTSAGPTSTSTSNQPGATVASDWTLNQTYQGASFFDQWSFWTTTDPTNGLVDYVDQATAQSSNLIGVNSAGNVLMQVETTQTVQAVGRKSVRITTDATWTGGLFIMDSVHMPTGCGTWPAFWTNGPNWPAGGEIDIVEGVNDYTNNQATLHTESGCTLASSNSATLAISGSLVATTDCSVTTTSNAGCGIRANSNISYGPGFNTNGGGVYAMEWDASGIAVYFFPRGSIPSDITAGTPVPSSWGLAQARWPAINCDPFTFFNDHSAIFDTTLCGDWASGVWNSTGVPGQDQSCAQRTGYSTCEAFVLASGSSFDQAYWEVKSFKVYQKKS